MKKIRQLSVSALLVIGVCASVYADTRITNITASTADVIWTTSTPLHSDPVRFGTSTSIYTHYSTTDCSGGVMQAISLEHCIRLLNLTPDTRYYVADPLVATGSSNEKNFKTAATLIMTQGTQVVQLPQPVTTVTVQNTTNNLYNITISWQNTIINNQTRYEIVKYQSGGTSSTISSTISASSTSYIDTVSSDGTYLYGVKACNSSGCSNVTPGSISIVTPHPTTTTATQSTTQTETALSVHVATTTTLVEPVTTSVHTQVVNTIATSTPTTTTLNATNTVPLAPSALTATLISETNAMISKVRLSWKDNSTDETRFRIYRSSTNGNTELPAISENTISYDDVVSTPGVYTYYISSANSLGYSQNITSFPVTVPDLRATAVIIQTMNLTSPLDISTAFGKVLPGAYVSIISGGKKLYVTAAQDGTFSIKVPDGVYVVEALTQNGGNGLTSKNITVNSGKVTSTSPVVISSSKKISGKVTLSSGVSVQDAEIAAYRNDTGQRITTVTDTDGFYSMDVTPGTWSITARPKNSVRVQAWEQSSVSTVTISYENVDEVKEQNFSVSPSTSDMKITITDESGALIPDIGVIIDTASITQTQGISGEVTRKIKTEKTGQDGTLITQTPPGVYYVRTAVGGNIQYKDATEQRIVLVSGQSKSITVTISRRGTSGDPLVTGITRFDDGSASESYVSAWSNEGGHTDTRTSSSGAYSISLTKGQTWHIKATKDISGKSYASDEQTVFTSNSNVTIDLVFVKSDTTKLPPPVAMRNDTTQASTLVTDNGARFNLPANGVSSTGNINIEIKATTEAPSQSGSSLVSTAYDVTIKDNVGQNISKLNKEAEILIPYSDEDLAAKGVSLQDVVPSYYDETIKSWVSVTNYIINIDKKVFVLHVNHLTRFALIAAADTTAPSSPTNVVTDAITPTDVRITWSNPTTDFNHSKIYRSETPGSFGKVVAAEVFSNSFIDKTSSLGKKVYYYTIRSVDSAGNESTNSNQLAVSTLGNTLADSKTKSSLLLPPGQAVSITLTRKLSLGSKGDDVLALQNALKYDGFYATGPITGYYGKLTENAVFRFQNYYKEVLLIPNGYKTGTGVVGEVTRKKINEIIAKSAQ